MKRVGYPGSSPFVSTTGDTWLAITDDEALEVDLAVARLIKRDEEIGSVLKTFYFNDCNMSLTARVMKISRQRAIVLIKCGEHWIDAKLEDTIAA